MSQLFFREGQTQGGRGFPFRERPRTKGEREARESRRKALGSAAELGARGEEGRGAEAARSGGAVDMAYPPPTSAGVPIRNQPGTPGGVRR